MNPVGVKYGRALDVEGSLIRHMAPMCHCSTAGKIARALGGTRHSASRYPHHTAEPVGAGIYNAFTSSIMGTNLMLLAVGRKPAAFSLHNQPLGRFLSSLQLLLACVLPGGTWVWCG